MYDGAHVGYKFSNKSQLIHTGQLESNAGQNLHDFPHQLETALHEN